MTKGLLQRIHVDLIDSFRSVIEHVWGSRRRLLMGYHKGPEEVHLVVRRSLELLIDSVTPVKAAIMKYLLGRAGVVLHCACMWIAHINQENVPNILGCCVGEQTCWASVIVYMYDARLSHS